jgi:hypothetical protein
MTLKIFALLLLSHVLGDVVFTSYKLAVLKRNPDLRSQIVAIGGHSSVHALLAGLLLFIFRGPWLIAPILVLTLHFLVDFIRCRTEMKLFGSGKLYVKRSELFDWLRGESKDPERMNIRNLWPWILIHALDQGSHLLCLLGIALII